jgi:rubredoxin
MVFASALNEDLYDLWMCRECGSVRAIGISEKNANAPVRNQKLEDHGLECPACGNKGAEKIVPKEDAPDW